MLLACLLYLCYLPPISNAAFFVVVFVTYIWTGPDWAWDETRSFQFRLIFHHMSKLGLPSSFIMSFSCINSVRFALVFLFAVSPYTGLYVLYGGMHA